MRKPSRPPTVKSVLEKIAEFDKNGRDWFLNRYAANCPTVCYYVVRNGKLYDLKALYAAAHRPSILPKTFISQQALAGFRRLDFKYISTKDVDAFLEGERRRKEISILSRSQAVVEKAKATFEPICMVCEFKFEKRYGSLGKDFIEYHHINPLSGRDGTGKLTRVRELAALCANCHRMIHRKAPCLTLKELKAKLRKISN